MERRLAQARHAEDAGEADQDNVEDSSVFVFLLYLYLRSDEQSLLLEQSDDRVFDGH